MQNLSNGEYISNLSSEINAKNNLFSQRKKKIHNNIAHFRQISNDIQCRNQVLQGYTLNMIKAKQKLEKEQQSFKDLHLQKNSKLDEDFSNINGKLDELKKHNQKINQEINEKKEMKQKYFDIIEENEKKIQKIEKRIRFNSKDNITKLKNEIEQLSLVLNETESHCQQFLDCVNSLDKDFDLIKKSKDSIHQEQFTFNQLIDMEETKYIQMKTQILVQTQNERTKQNNIRKERERYIQLKQKHELKKKMLSNKINEILAYQSKIMQKILILKEREKKIKHKYTGYKNCYKTQNSNTSLNGSTKDKNLNKMNLLLHEIDKCRDIKNEINTKIEIEKLSILQNSKMSDLLRRKVEDSYINEKVDSNNFPFIFDFLKDLKNLEIYSLNEIEKWENNSMSSSNIECMLRKWDKLISF